MAPTCPNFRPSCTGSRRSTEEGRHVYLHRTVHPIEFLKKHAKPHIIVAHYDPLDHQDENGIGPVTYRIAPGIVMNTLDLAGECTDMIDPEACTLNVMFELGEDAAKLRLATQIDRFRNARHGEGAPQFICWSVSTCSLQLECFRKLLGGVSSEALAYLRSALASARPLNQWTSGHCNAGPGWYESGRLRRCRRAFR